jgi:hypothetical protein
MEERRKEGSRRQESLSPPANSQEIWISTERSLHHSAAPSLHPSNTPSLSHSRLDGVFCNNFGGYRDYAFGELRLGFKSPGYGFTR